MRLQIVPEFIAVRESDKYDVPTAIISIVGLNDKYVIFADNPNIKAIFRMKFNDLDLGEGRFTEFQEAVEEDFEGLKEFVDSLHDLNVEQLIIHCYGGISRSAAVGAAVNEYLGLNENIWNNKIFFPNLHVYKLACNELGMKRTRKDIDRLFKLRGKISMFSDAELKDIYKMEKVEQMIRAKKKIKNAKVKKKTVG